jgi:hypothetical protein
LKPVIVGKHGKMALRCVRCGNFILAVANIEENMLIESNKAEMNYHIMKMTGIRSNDEIKQWAKQELDKLFSKIVEIES